VDATIRATAPRVATSKTGDLFSRDTGP
jgi:hypothetical protein